MGKGQLTPSAALVPEVAVLLSSAGFRAWAVRSDDVPVHSTHMVPFTSKPLLLVLLLLLVAVDLRFARRESKSICCWSTARRRMPAKRTFGRAATRESFAEHYARRAGRLPVAFR